MIRNKSPLNEQRIRFPGMATSLATATHLSSITRRPTTSYHERAMPGSRRLVVRRVLEPKNEDYGARLIASSTYLLPLLDSLTFGRFIFIQFPFVARALSPLAPLAALYHSFPLAPFLAFLAIYSGVANNSNFSRFVRFNASQAVLLDVLLVIPNIILTDVFKPPSDGLGFELYLQAFNTIFLYALVNVGLGMGATLIGTTQRLPFVADAADNQVSRM